MVKAAILFMLSHKKYSPVLVDRHTVTTTVSIKQISQVYSRKEHMQVYVR